MVPGSKDSITISLSFTSFLKISLPSVVSRLIGARNIPRAEHALGNAIVLNVVLSLAITAAGLAATDFWLRLMGSSETILPYARDYMRVVVAGMAFPTLAMALSALAAGSVS